MKSSDKNKKDFIEKKRLVNSFKYAFEGIKEAFQGEQNLRIHVIMAILVIISGFIVQISKNEWFICLILIGLVFMAEFFNTAIENTVDLITREYNPMAKKAKDIASGAVLIVAIISAIIGLMIFIPKYIIFIKGVM